MQGRNNLARVLRTKLAGENRGSKAANSGRHAPVECQVSVKKWPWLANEQHF